MNSGKSGKKPTQKKSSKVLYTDQNIFGIERYKGFYFPPIEQDLYIFYIIKYDVTKNKIVENQEQVNVIPLIFDREKYLILSIVKFDANMGKFFLLDANQKEDKEYKTLSECTSYVRTNLKNKINHNNLLNISLSLRNCFIGRDLDILKGDFSIDHGNVLGKKDFRFGLGKNEKLIKYENFKKERIDLYEQGRKNNTLKMNKMPPPRLFKKIAEKDQKPNLIKSSIKKNPLPQMSNDSSIKNLLQQIRKDNYINPLKDKKRKHEENPKILHKQKSGGQNKNPFANKKLKIVRINSTPFTSGRDASSLITSHEIIQEEDYLPNIDLLENQQKDHKNSLHHQQEIDERMEGKQDKDMDDETDVDSITSLDCFHLDLNISSLSQEFQDFDDEIENQQTESIPTKIEEKTYIREETIQIIEQQSKPQTIINNTNPCEENIFESARVERFTDSSKDNIEKYLQANQDRVVLNINSKDDNNFWLYWLFDNKCFCREIYLKEGLLKIGDKEYKDVDDIVDNHVQNINNKLDALLKSKYFQNIKNTEDIKDMLKKNGYIITRSEKEEHFQIWKKSKGWSAENQVLSHVVITVTPDFYYLRLNEDTKKQFSDLKKLLGEYLLFFKKN